MSRTYRKPYTKSKRFDRTCRNHGSCPYCMSNRTFSDRKKRYFWKLDLKDFIMGRHWELANPTDCKSAR